MANAKKEEKPERINTCNICGKPKKVNQFYKSNKKEFALNGGVLPYCKSCLKNMCINENKVFDINLFKDTLKLIDKPFIQKLYDSALRDRRDTFGAFMSLTNMNDNAELGWKDSDDFKVDKEINNKNITINENNKQNTVNELTTNFQITKEVMKKWGEGYSQKQYEMLEDIYDGMRMSFTIENRSQEEYLKTACLYQMKNLEAIREGNSGEAQKWGQLFDKYMESGKLKPNQLNALDMMGNINNFSEFFEHVEKVGFIPKFPDIILDDIDYAIFCFINYNRELQGYDKLKLGDIKEFVKYDYVKGQEIIASKIKEDIDG